MLEDKILQQKKGYLKVMIVQINETLIIVRALSHLT